MLLQSVRKSHITRQYLVLCAVAIMVLGPVEALAQFGGIIIDNSRASLASAGAIWSNSPIGTDKNDAKDNGHVAINTTAKTVINTVGSTNTLTQSPNEQNAAFSLDGYGELSAGSGAVSAMTFFASAADQLFDFARYKAAATATGNLYTLCSFMHNVADSVPMYGIVYVTVDVSNDGGTATDKLDEPNCGSRAGKKSAKLKNGSVNVLGTLVFDLINGDVDTIKAFKVKVEVPMFINPAHGPASLSTTLTRQDYLDMEAAATASTSATQYTWPSGYHAAWETVKTQHTQQSPVGKALTGFASFSNTEDYLALMYNGGIVDIHGAANISGAVYTPHFIEIEQKQLGQVQYIHGALISGAGVYLEDDDGAHGMAIVFDPTTFDSLLVAKPEFTTLTGIVAK